MQRRGASQRRAPPRSEYKKVCVSYSTQRQVLSRRDLESSLLLPHTDLTELDLPSTMKTTWPDPADLLNFNLTISPDEGQ